MGNGDGGGGDAASGRRCPKHPSQPPFTGFCSACLLDRLHATNLVGLASPCQPQPPPPAPALLHQHLEEELPPAEAADSRRIGAGRTTLLQLFQLEDQGAEGEERAQASTSGGDAQDPPPHLQRKRSLRHSCSDWIACCDTSAAANHSSCIPSRQSLELDTAAAAAVAVAAPANPNPNGAAAAAARANGVSVVERRTGSLRWNQVWTIKGLLAKPAGLNRSFSESSRSKYALRHGGGAIARSSSSRSQGVRLNGSRSMSSAGNGMDSSEISLPGDSAGHCRPRLKDRLHWLRRSRSVHYSPPSRGSTVDAGLTPFRSRSSSTRSTAAAHKNHRRFAAIFFPTQRHRH